MEKNLRRKGYLQLAGFKKIIFSSGFIMVSLAINAQTGYSVSSPVKIAEIRKLELCDLPQQMVMRIKQLPLKEMVAFREEYQETINDPSGEQVVKTIQLRYADDHIVGYVKTAPLLQSSNIVVSNVQIRVPLVWGCIPGVGHSQQHSATSFSQLKAFEASDNCVGWHQMKEGEHLVPPPEKKKRKKLLGIVG